MTVKEFYQWAIENEAEDLEIQIRKDDCGATNCSEFLNEQDIYIYAKEKCVSI